MGRSEEDSSRLRRCAHELAAYALCGAMAAFPFPLAAKVATAPSPTGEVTFRLVPEASWNGGKPRQEAHLPEGEVLLYREGESEPALIARANEATGVPAGTWLWIAQAPGFVSTGSGVLEIPAGSPRWKKTLIWPVVPACRIQLKGDPGWPQVQRLDLVSLSRGSVYPVSPSNRKTLWIPTGRFLAYSVGPRGLIGIQRPATCGHNEEVGLAPPPPPAASRQDLMVALVAPGKNAELARHLTPRARDLGAVEGGGYFAPIASLWQGERGVFFFLGLPASGPAIEIAATHPELRRSQVVVPSAGGTAREIPDLGLKARRTLTFEIDFAPKRQHTSQELLLYHCGEERFDDPYVLVDDGCEEVSRRDLTEGGKTYSFARLDDGQYLAVAKVDGESIHGLGLGVAPFLSPDDDGEPTVVPIRLAEREIFGNLLVHGKAVPGEVRLRPLVESGGGPVLSFRTDEDLLYHLTYFGHSPAEEAGQRSGAGPAEVKSARVSPFYIIEGCAEAGACRPFPVQTRLAGDGRLDLEIGGKATLKIRALRASDDSPLAGASIYTAPGLSLTFENGRSSWSQPRGREAERTETDAQGEALIALPHAGDQTFGVAKEGFASQKLALLVAEGESAERVVRLRPDRNESGVQLVFPEGTPARRAFLLAVGPQGERDIPCSRAADPEGIVDLPETCLPARSFLLVHPEGRLQFLPGAQFRGPSKIVVARSPAAPIRLLLRDEEGQGVAQSTVSIALAGGTVTPNDLLFSYSRTGFLLFYLSDAEGEILLRGVDPADPEILGVIPMADSRSASHPVAGLEPGGTLALTLR